LTEGHVVCAVVDLPPGERKVVHVGKVSIGVLNVDGEIYALRNRCPHRGGLLCEGYMGGTLVPSSSGSYEFRDSDYIVQCPWHRWEFDVRTGETYPTASTFRAKTYPVTFDGENVLVWM
jgi:nitrite reductase/ring-hydroxylating ferredoxin subunit